MHIFPESMRGTGEGHYDWDLKPQTKMTNANVEQTVAGVDGQMLSVKYKDGEKKVLVTPETAVVTYVTGDRSRPQAGDQDFCRRREKTAGRNRADPAYHLWQGWVDAADVSAARSIISATKTNFNREDRKMRSIVSMILAACAMAVVSSPTLAEPPAPAAPPSPPACRRHPRCDTIRYSLRCIDRA